MIAEAEIKFRQLPTEFPGLGEVAGYFFKQIFKDDHWYIYEVSLEGKISHFEVFRKRELLAGGFAKENYIPYPRADAFGKWAWTGRTLEDAFELINRKENQGI